MAEINNYAEMSENFDTIKTLLNSIRAQGILNTSDVDKLLSGINTKLEKINTEEDIDLIKAFLSELKSNLDERHNVLISKFGAIESLFSNLLKNSSETIKSSEVKELFDIVATNLSVFSREVVAQKDILTDITLRLDNMRSDDSQKKDIIRNINNLKTDVEHLNNGFDSIVLSLNENFKTVLKSIADVDQTDMVTQFGSQITDIVNSSNTILSALQLLDKKNSDFEEALKGLATQEDLSLAKRNVAELTTKNQELTNSVQTLVDKSYKLDSLSEKIDASVNIIAGLKSAISESDEQSTHSILDKLLMIEDSIKDVSSTKDFDSLQKSLDSVIREILNNYVLTITNIGEDIKYKVSESNDKLAQILEANITRTISDLTSNTDSLSLRLQESHNSITDLFQDNFGSISDAITGLKGVISQLDENNVSSNNAIFSNITDRLAIFENSLKNSLEKQEDFVSNSSAKLVEQLNALKNVSNNLDYKMDSSIIEVTNTKQELAGLKSSVDEVLALDFTNVVKNFKADLYAIKQDLSELTESTGSDISEKLRNDMFGKYELLINRLDNVEDEVKSVQTSALGEIHNILDKISSSIVDILSYVSVRAENSTLELDSKISDIEKIIKDNNLSYIENVKYSIDSIREQICEDLAKISDSSAQKIDSINETISNNTYAIRDDILKSYNKLIDVQANFDEIKESLNNNKLTFTTNVDSMLESAESVKSEFDSKLAGLRNNLLEKLSDFKKEFSCESADNISEIKFSSESLHARAIEQSKELKEELQSEIETIIEGLKLRISDLKENIVSSTLKIEGSNNDIVKFVKDDFSTDLNSQIDNLQSNIDGVLADINGTAQGTAAIVNELETSIKTLSSETKNSLSATLAKILDNFVSLKSLINSIGEQNADDMKYNTESLKQDFSELKQQFEALDSTVDDDLNRQFALFERNFDTLTALISNETERNADILSERIDSHLNNTSKIISDSVSDKLDEYKEQIEALFDNIKTSNGLQADFLKEKVIDLNNVLESAIDTQNSNLSERISEVSLELNDILSHNIELTREDYDGLKTKLIEITKDIEQNNAKLVNSLKEQLDDITKYIDSGITAQAQDFSSKIEDLSSEINDVSAKFIDIENSIKSRVDNIKNDINLLADSINDVHKEDSNRIITSLDELIGKNIIESNELFSTKASNLQNLIENLSDSLQDSFVSNAKDILAETSSLQGIFSKQLETIKNCFQSTIEFQVEQITDILTGKFEEQSLGLLTNITDSSKQISDDLNTQRKDLLSNLDTLINKFSDFELSNTEIYTNSLEELKEQFNTYNSSLKDSISNNIESLSASLTDTSNLFKDTSDNTIEHITENIQNSVAEVKQNSLVCKDILSSLIKEQIDIVSQNIEKETDVVVRDLLEQFAIIKDAQKDDISTYTDRIENTVEGYIVDAVNDLKSYYDVRTDSSTLNSKLDNLRLEMEKNSDEVLENINKMLDVSVFSNTIDGLKNANEVLITSMAEKLNGQIKEFVSQNVIEEFGTKLEKFDKEFVDVVVAKYDNVHKVAQAQNESISAISNNIKNLLCDFNKTSENLELILKSKVQEISNTLSSLAADFTELKSKLLSKDNPNNLLNEVVSIESLVKEQMNYIEDISELCCNNLPEVNEIGTLLKHSIMKSIEDISSNIITSEDVSKDLNNLKTDIITQFINVFNQISFVAEQEEIIDYIQEKHDELITVLSHIVTTSDSFEVKVDSIKDDISSLNEKINAIISSDGNVDYIYSLQDLESDIANLRLVLNDMQSGAKSKELEELVTSTNNIYELVEAIKAGMPNLDNLADDIVSISSRTNKLLLTSDESYKTLQDNLQDFKLVINDLDERTRNFAQDAGLDKIDSKLGAINSMIQNGAKTNQVFNQVFEYLAEWVDSAGSKISAISAKVESLDEISQIKLMIEDLKAEAEDTTASTEIVNAMSNVFDKQIKKISSLESKLDRIIVDNTINSKNNKLDLTPLEETINRFLVAMDDKIEYQQKKIDALEAKISEVVDSKDTAQLTKKVGGMDRQIAKLNKSIEKIASHVVEK